MSENKTQPTPVLVQDLGMKLPTKNSKQFKRFGRFVCQCGVEFEAQIANVRNMNTKSCGCHKIQATIKYKTTHGMRNHRLYNTWTMMIQRTGNKNHNKFNYYGGRGISVCDRWKDISNFIEDMYPTYEEGLTLDRIDNNGNYEPSNCRWAKNDTQRQNTRAIRSNNTSGYRGVSFNSNAGKFVANISHCNKNVYLGLFSTALDAATAYNEYVIKNNTHHTMNTLELY